jgi:uncharacterized integral membrane protein
MHSSAPGRRDPVYFSSKTGKMATMSSDPHQSADHKSADHRQGNESGGSSAPSDSTFPLTRAAALWSALIVGFLILIVLLIFIAQNPGSAEFSFLSFHWSLPLGVAILLAAVAGGLVTVLVGTVRIYQLRRAAKKNFASRQ